MSVHEGDVYDTFTAPACVSSEKKGSPIKLENLKCTPQFEAYVDDVQGESVEIIREFLDSSDGDTMGWFNGNLVQKVEGITKAGGAEWIVAL